MRSGKSRVPLEAVLCTEELKRRPTRPPDYETENRALAALAQALADSPRTILQTLADTILEIFHTDSAGISRLTADGKRFYWPAIAGAWQPHIGGGTPRDFGPCGDVLDWNGPLLFRRFERRYAYFRSVTPLCEEGLLIPFYVKGEAVGTLWAIAHDDRRKFDAEDLRQLESLGRFASAAYQATESLDAALKQRGATHSLREDAAQSSQAMERVDRELRESEAFNRSIVESSPDCIKVLDLAGNLLSMQSGQALLGIEDIRPFLNKAWLDFWEGEDRLAARAAVAAAVAGQGGRFVGFFRTLRGEPKWWDVKISPILDKNGKPARLLAVSRDVTERKQTADALRESEERYRYLFDSMDEGFCVIEMIFDEQEKPVDYRFLDVNPAFEQLTGMHGALGKRIREFAPDLESYWCEIYGKVALTGEPIRFTNQAKELGERWFDLNAFRIGEPDSRKVAVIFNNITERMMAEQRLRVTAEELADLDRRKDEFLAMLSHELRNPLAPISNAVQLLRLQKNEDPLQQQARTIIERQVGQLNHLVDDLLEVSRITTGRVQLRQDRIVVSGIVERAVETVHPLLVQRRHELTVSVPPQPIWLHADAARLEQVVVNLLTNAAKYTDDGGHIWLMVEQEGDAAVLRVRDTGVGIAPELLPHIFDLFTQAERSLDRSQGGLGIGLCLVQRLVDLHGGTVEVYSVLGQGSEFVVRLPVMLTTMPSSPSPSIETAQPRAKSCGVLVVDDNVDAAQSLALLLKMSGHDVRMAYDGPSALEAALALRPDVVLLDIGLPGLSGFEVAKRIRQLPTLENIMLVAMTGYGQEADRQRSHEAGFDHHLVKPADFGKVQKILATVSGRA